MSFLHFFYYLDHKVRGSFFVAANCLCDTMLKSVNFDSVNKINQALKFVGGEECRGLLTPTNITWRVLVSLY